MKEEECSVVIFTLAYYIDTMTIIIIILYNYNTSTAAAVVFMSKN